MDWSEEPTVSPPCSANQQKPEIKARNPNTDIRNPIPEIRNPIPVPINQCPKPGSRNPKPETRAATRKQMCDELLFLEDASYKMRDSSIKTRGWMPTLQVRPLILQIL